MAFDTQLFTNNAVALLATPISAGAASLTVMAGLGSLYPSPASGEYFLVTLEDQAGTVREIIRVNGRTDDTFTGLVRGQEGTTAQAWSASLGSDTLVDHRVTAETMRLAMLLPEGGPAGADGAQGPAGPAGPAGADGAQGPAGTSITVQEEGVIVGITATSFNFVGDSVTVTGATGAKTITITGNAGGGTINGSSPTAPTNIDPGWAISASNAGYSNYQRGFKFFVTLYMPANSLSSTFEVLGNVSGNIGADAETVSFNRTARVGYNFLGSVDIILNKTLKTLDLVWTNNEANPVEVMCTRIQHLI